MGRLEGKIAIVTGGARGMGEATVRRFVAEGAQTLIVDRVSDGEALAAELGTAARYCSADISSEADWVRALAECEGAFGTPDILVNNAAIMRFRSILECDPADFREVLDVNLLGTFLGLKTVGQAMVKKNRGSIVNISSVDGLRGANGYAAYSASKWGVRGLTKVASLEFGPRGVRVNSVHPGGIWTAMGNPADTPVDEINKGFGLVPAQRMGHSEEVAAATAFLASDEASYIMGAELAVDGGWTAGIYNPMLAGSPDDLDYGKRDETHGIAAYLDDAFRAKQGKR